MDEDIRFKDVLKATGSMWPFSRFPVPKIRFWFYNLYLPRVSGWGRELVFSTASQMFPEKLKYFSLLVLLLS